MNPARPQVVLGVGAGIAAYKVGELLRLLTESGHDVRVVPTSDSLHFVGAATWEALSGQRVDVSVFEDVPRCRTYDWAGTPTWSWWHQPPPTCLPRPPTGSRTTS
jgi:phosphopantothenoylcysteine synthetase/decarboxylase